ncbi:MAG: hypothetical protein OFPI_14300 [Osedax symbiont Rs2]|nr:MAG: hypothetical protein OFPI_14300 [Osedax symbiont Rs2]
MKIHPVQKYLLKDSLCIVIAFIKLSEYLHKVFNRSISLQSNAVCSNLV